MRTLPFLQQPSVCALPPCPALFDRPTPTCATRCTAVASSPQPRGDLRKQRCRRARFDPRRLSFRRTSSAGVSVRSARRTRRRRASAGVALGRMLLLLLELLSVPAAHAGHKTLRLGDHITLHAATIHSASATNSTQRREAASPGKQLVAGANLGLRIDDLQFLHVLVHLHLHRHNQQQRVNSRPAEAAQRSVQQAKLNERQQERMSTWDRRRSTVSMDAVTSRSCCCRATGSLMKAEISGCVLV